MTTTRPQIPASGQYSMSEAAKLLGIDRKTLYRWRKCGYFKTKIRRVNKQPYAEAMEILKMYDLCV